jgi:hypothetical protein
MKSLFTRTLLLSVIFLATNASAQMNPVVLLKGTVMTADGKPATVRLSTHETGAPQADSADEITTCAIQEITASRANSASGRYVLILKPARKYWLHMEGTFLQSIDTLIETPKSDKYVQLEKNFVVNWRIEPTTGEPAAAKKD